MGILIGSRNYPRKGFPIGSLSYMGCLVKRARRFFVTFYLVSYNIMSLGIKFSCSSYNCGKFIGKFSRQVALQSFNV